MVEPVRNRRSAIELDDQDVDCAIARIAGRDLDRSRDAQHVFSTLTWGEGPGQIDQSAVQPWLWYQLPTKYFTDEPGYMTRLAAALGHDDDLDALASKKRAAGRPRDRIEVEILTALREERADGDGRPP